ncbi:hypothetical protein AGR4C_Lc10094 [Agrobacterium tumefaciens str. Kerr 14]|uniref:Uncharacterized protein n=1 Tax=Agrobacterium tumefaciens str. Kerr 14 TaxID=1183424 RepID=A0A1S7QZU8_AGRTU|nr:hypothetical protein AGR4C_Lc10094 [Agrobacterium tumefaciens str. Kerr 14]
MQVLRTASTHNFIYRILAVTQKNMTQLQEVVS